MNKSTYNITVLKFDQDHHVFCKAIQSIRHRGIEPTVTLTGFVVYVDNVVAGMNNNCYVDITEALDNNFGMLDEQTVIGIVNKISGSSFPDDAVVAKALEVSYG